MTREKKSIEPKPRGDSKMRVDLAHAPPIEDVPASAVPLDLLHAIAGHDEHASTQQLRSQAIDLAAILQEKQRVLEKREAELNARAAVLENDLRRVRLKNQDRSAPSTPSEAPASATGTATAPANKISELDPSREASRDRPVEAEPVPATAHPHEENSLRQQQATRIAKGSSQLGLGIPQIDSQTTKPRAPRATDAPTKSESETRKDSRSSPASPAGQTQEDESRRIAAQLQNLEQQRRNLRHREQRLHERQENVNRTHEEVTRLHREALELRLATEYVWEEMLEEFPGRKHESAVDEVRRKLADHYRLANDTLGRRKDELHQLRAELNDQENQLRQQRRELQMWADRRYDEVETRLAQLIVREREIDRQEAAFQRQSLQWQQQREAYRKEIEALSAHAKCEV